MKVLRTKSGPGNDRRGAALMVSLVAVMVVAGLGAGLIQMQAAIGRKQAFSVDRRRALYVAEAGISEAALAVSQGKSGMIASEAVPAAFGGGLFWVETADLPDDKIALICTSQVGSAEFVLRTLVIPNLNPVASLGFFGSDGVEIGWGTVADGYHSGRGTFAAQLDLAVAAVATTGQNLKLASNADIVLEESTVGGPLSGASGGSSPLSPGDLGSGAGGTTTGATGSGGDTGTSHLSAPGGEEGETGERSSSAWSSLIMSDEGDGDGASRSGVEGDTDDPLGGTGDPGGGATGAPLEGGGAPDPGSGGDKSGSTSSGGPPPGDPTRLFGTLAPGPEGFVQSGGLSEVVGSIDPLRYPKSLPRVTFSVISETLTGNVTINTSQSGVGTHDETRVTGLLTVSPGATLTLFGPTVLDLGSLELEAGATLRLDDTAGPIQIYVRDGMRLALGSMLQSVADHTVARGTSIVVGELSGHPDRVRVQCSGTFHGVMYAPSDELTIPASLRYYGAAAARILRTERGARISYDRRLAVGGEGLPTLPKILSWQIVPVGDGTARRLMLDPIVELRLRGVVPLAPADATPESEVDVQYIDLLGDGQKYSGPITGFDPTVAKRVLGLRWDDPRDGLPRDWLRPAGDDPTDAITSDRSDGQLGRTAILGLHGSVDVGSLTDAEMIDLITTLPSDILATTDAEVQAMDERTGGGATRRVPPTVGVFDLETWFTTATRKNTLSETDELPVPPG